MKIGTISCLAALAVTAGLPAACSSASKDPEPSSVAAEPVSANTLLPPDCTNLSNLPTGGWPSFGQNVCNTRSATLAGLITPQTVSKLSVKWTYTAAGDISATPAVVDGDVYVPDWGGKMSRIDGRTGRPVWSISVGALIGVPIPDAGAADAGAPTDTPAPIVARDTPVVTADSVIFGLVFGGLFGSTAAAYVVSVDRSSGALKWSTQVDAHPAAVVTSSPLLENGKLYVGVSSAEESFSLIPNYPCCSFRGSVVSLDAKTGKLLWKTYTIDNSAYFQSDGVTPSGFAGAAVWSSPALDRRRNSLYVTTGNNYTAPEGVTTLPPGNHIESIMALDLNTGAIKWSQRMTEGDAFVIADLFLSPPGGGPDWDFGAGANLFRTQIGGKAQDLVGAGQKSGIYWALDADTGSVVWKTPVGPGGHLGGIHWGTAVDAQRVYVGVNDQTGEPYTLQGTGPQGGTTTSVGSWAALDKATGAVDWQVANPSMTAPEGGTSVNGPLSVVNGVVFGGSMDTQGTMFAFDAATGKILWSFVSGGSVYGGPAIGVDGTVYWGNGMPNSSRLLFGTPGGKLYAFRVSL